MAEGFFPPHDLPVPGIAPDALIGSMVRILPRTVLRLDLAANDDEPRTKARNEALPDGGELWHRWFTAADVARCADPEFAMGMVRHEFCSLVKAGACFPQSVPLQGSGTGFAVSPQGHVLTNFHMVTSEITNHQREAGAVNSEVRCRSLRAQIATRAPDGVWTWQDAAEVWLVSNPPTARALEEDAAGLSHPREDTALLRVEPPPAHFLRLAPGDAAHGMRIWMAGFPLRSARRPEALAAHGYRDADGSLRVASGQVTVSSHADYFEADVDGSMGNSGSPALDATGSVVGLFSRATGHGPRNAFEYGHVSRVFVRSRVAVAGLGLAAVLTR